MQAQTVQQRSGAPWIALLLALVFAAAVVIGVQFAFRGNDVGTTTGPAVQSQVDLGVGAPTVNRRWSSHRVGTPLTPAQAQRAKQLINGQTSPDFLPAMARGEAFEIRGGRS